MKIVNPSADAHTPSLALLRFFVVASKTAGSPRLGITRFRADVKSLKVAGHVFRSACDTVVVSPREIERTTR